MKMEHHHGQRGCRTGRGGARAVVAGFTLIEILVVIALIAVLMGLVASGLNRATKTARLAASQRSAAAIVQAVDQFRNEFGFLPPLVHDGEVISAGDAGYRPLLFDGSVSEEGPVLEQTGGTYNYKTIVAWNEGLDFNFFRKRTGSGADDIDLPGGGGVWNDDAAWDDRRYSKYTMAYYLTGALDKDVDGVRGPGFARPNIDGTFLGVGYPVGSVRDRYAPLMDVERRGARLSVDYVEPAELPEHGVGMGAEPPSYDDVRDMYEDFQKPALVAIVDSFGNAFRYYRWEPGRFVNGQLVVENPLDLNIPPVLIDPLIYAQVRNDPLLAEADGIDITGGNAKLRNARYAVVSAGPDGLLGTENIETIAAVLGTEVPGDLDDQALMRQSVWTDNAVEVGN